MPYTFQQWDRQVDRARRKRERRLFFSKAWKVLLLALIAGLIVFIFVKSIGWFVPGPGP